MADFVAVLRKTIDGLGEATPDMRKRVYDKARSTVAAKLAAISPPPPASVADRQRRSLEDAIAEVERGYAAPAADPFADEGDPLDRLQNIFPSLGTTSGSRSAYATPSPAPRPATPTPRPVPPLAPLRGTGTDVAAAPPLPARNASAAVPPAPAPQPGYGSEFDTANDDADEPLSQGPVFAGEAVDDDREPADFQQAEPRERRSYAGLAIAAVVVVALAAGGYAAWINKDALQAALGIGGSEVATEQPATTEPATPTPVDTAAADIPAASEPLATKFTQRLNSDGTEVDEGPAGGVAGVGEGTSVAGVTQPPTLPVDPAAPATDGAPADGTTPTVPTEGTPADATTTPPADGAAATEQPAVAVAQKAIFYEERTTVAQGSADTGSIVWSVVQESPGGDLPPEPAIRAQATIPAKNIQLTMTIRRNGDKTLPFSHMIELIFLTPEGFGGGGIDNILRFALKNTEQEAGSSIRGTPAKIAEGFFLVALNDAPAEVEANIALLRGQDWIDIPLVYKSGRRALITMEKGVPGSQVFDQVLKAWQGSTSG
ncbi:MAG: hypothetical protein AB7S80_14795 [Rhizobiaceae bacterium]